MKPIVPFLLACLLVWPLLLSSAEFHQGEMAGNQIEPAEKAPRDINGGFSLDDDRSSRITPRTTAPFLTSRSSHRKPSCDGIDGS